MYQTTIEIQTIFGCIYFYIKRPSTYFQFESLRRHVDHCETSAYKENYQLIQALGSRPKDLEMANVKRANDQTPAHFVRNERIQRKNWFASQKWPENKSDACPFRVHSNAFEGTFGHFWFALIDRVVRRQRIRTNKSIASLWWSEQVTTINGIVCRATFNFKHFKFDEYQLDKKKQKMKS